MQHLCYRIVPYRTKLGWQFDDAKVGLVAEKITDGVPEVFLAAAAMLAINDPLAVYFSDRPLGGRVRWLQLWHVGPLREGNLYHFSKARLDCWFCPALLRYFPEPPAVIHFKPATGFHTRISALIAAS